MRDKCDEIHRKQYKQLRKILITLCLESHERYYSNILRMITICYHLYVDHEIYAMAYNKKRNCLNDHIFIKNKTSKWDDDNSWEEVLGKSIKL